MTNKALLISLCAARFAAAESPPEPSLKDLREAAVRASGLDPRRGESFARRARLAGYVPELTLRALRAVGEGEGLRLTAAATDSQRYAVNDDAVFEARATWNLPRIVFDPAEIRASRESARLFLEVVDLEMEVTRLYYERRRAQMASSPSSLAVDELTAQLDVITGGYLSRALEGAGKPARHD